MGAVNDIMRRRWEDGGSSGGWNNAPGAGSSGPPALVMPIGGATALYDGSRGITQSGGLLSAWVDQTGNGHTATQGTPANQPGVLTNVFGTRGAIQFGLGAGTQSLATGLACNLTDSPVARTVHVVYIYRGTILQDRDWFNGTSGGSQIQMRGIGTGPGRVAINLSGVSVQLACTVGDTNNVVIVRTYRMVGSNTTNGLGIRATELADGRATMSGTFTGTGTWTIGNGPLLGTGVCADVGAIVIYDGATPLTDAQCWQNEQYLLQQFTGATPFNPFSLGWSGAYWADDGQWNAMPAGGGNLSTWRDGSAVALDLTAAGPPVPTWVAQLAALNNHASVAVAAGGTIGIGAGAPTPSQPVTHVFIGNVDAVAGASNANILSTVGTTISEQTGTSNLGGFAGSNAFTAGGTNGAHTMRALFNGASSSFVIDGAATSVSPGTQAAGASRWVNSFTGATNQGGAFHHAFLGVYPGDVTTDPNWNAFKAWVTSFYGLTIG